MALPTVRKLSERIYTTHLADVSADSSALLAPMGRGLLTEVHTVLHIAISAAAAVITLKKNGVSLSQTITIDSTGAAVGTIDSLILAPPVTVDFGDVIEFDSDGGSSTTAPITIYSVVDESRA